MKYYKVVSRKSKKLFSAISNRNMYNCSPIRYTKNRWTYPKIDGSKLFVFSDLNVAKFFAREFADFNLVVYECDVFNPTVVSPITLISSLYDITLKEYWSFVNRDDYKNLYTLGLGLAHAKDYTIFCDAVMLTKKVSGEKGE